MMATNHHHFHAKLSTAFRDPSQTTSSDDPNRPSPFLSTSNLVMSASLNLLATLAFASIVIGQQWQMVPGSLDAASYNGLIGCVKQASTRYDVAVLNGVVVIVPPEGGAIDLDSEADHALGSCLDNFSHTVHLAVDETRATVSEPGAVSTSQALATYQWAESHGAQSMNLHPSTSQRREAPMSPNSGSLLPRAASPGYYFSLGSASETDCSHYDQQNNVLNECISFGKSYRSIRFSNPSQTNGLRVKRWPHHLCNQDRGWKDGSRWTTVYPQSDSACYNSHPDDVFSFVGKPTPACILDVC